MTRGASGTRRMSSTRVLVADDSRDGRELAEEILTYSGMEVVTVATGLDALETATNLKPDLILMDLSMPGMDGWEVIRRLKSDPKTKSIRIIAFTAHALESHRSRAREAGCDGVITKPCLPDVLVDKVRAVLAGEDVDA